MTRANNVVLSASSGQQQASGPAEIDVILCRHGQTDL